MKTRTGDFRMLLCSILTILPLAIRPSSCTLCRPSQSIHVRHILPKASFRSEDKDGMNCYQLENFELAASTLFISRMA